MKRETPGVVPDRGPASGSGRILRIKQGYNPNSSSIGSLVFVLPDALLGITALFGAVSAALMAHFLGKPGRAGGERGFPPEVSPPVDTGPGSTSAADAGPGPAPAAGSGSDAGNRGEDG